MNIGRSDTFWEFYNNHLGYFQGKCLHIQGRARIKASNADGKWIEAEKDSVFDLTLEIPNTSRFILKWQPSIDLSNDEEGNTIGFTANNEILTSDGSTVVVQSYRESPKGRAPIPIVNIKNYDPKDQDIPLAYTGLVFLWPFQVIFNKEWYGPLDSLSHSANISLKKEDKECYIYTADGVNVFSDMMDNAPRIDEVRRLLLAGKKLFVAPDESNKAASASNQTAKVVPFELVISKVPGNPIKKLSIITTEIPGSNDITTRNTYDVQEFMPVGSVWFPKRMTYQFLALHNGFQVDITFDKAEFRNSSLSDQELKPQISSRSIIIDRRLNVSFTAGSAPEDILRQFQVISDTSPQK